MKTRLLPLLGITSVLAGWEPPVEKEAAPAGAEKVYLDEKLMDFQPQIEGIQLLMQRQEWSQALVRIQKLMSDRSSHDVLFPENGNETDERYIPLRRFLYEMVLRDFPPDQIASYREQIYPQVERALKAALEDGDVDALRRLREAADVTPLAHRVSKVLGDIEWERGSVAQACEYWRSVLAPETDEWRTQDPRRARIRNEEIPGARLRLAIGLAALGRYEDARRETKEIPWVAQLPERAAGQGDVAQADWPRFGGNNRGTLLSPPIRSEIHELKGSDAVGSGAPQQMPPHMRHFRFPGTQQGQPAGAQDPFPYFPAVWNDRLYLFDGHLLRAYDVETGKLVGKGNPIGDQVQPAASGSVDPLTGQPIAPTRLHAVTLREPEAFVVVPVQDAATNRPPNNPWARAVPTSSGKLVSYDLASLKLTGKNELAADRSHLSLVGSPLVIGRAVYCAAVDTATNSNSAYLVRFDVETKRERWRTFLSATSLGGGANRFAPFGGSLANMWPATLAEAGGMVFISTNRGAVVAVRADSGERIWASRYAVNIRQVQAQFRRMMGDQVLEGWGINPVIVHAGKVVVAPVDSRELVCYSAATGRLEWKWTPMGEELQVPFRHVLGPARGRLYLIGGTRGVVVDFQNGIRLGKAGETQIRIPSPGVSGRPALADDVLYIPYKSGIVTVDLETLKLGHDAVVWDKTGGEVAGRNRYKLDGGNLILTDRVLVAVSDDAFRIYSVMRPEEAETSYRSRIRNEPLNPRNYRMLGRLLLQAGREEEAHGVLAQGARVLEPVEADCARDLIDEMASVLGQRARRLIDEGKAQEAVSWLSGFLSKEPKVLCSAPFLDELGQVYVLAGEREKALDVYAKLAALSGPEEFARGEVRFSRLGLASQRVRQLLAERPEADQRNWISRQRAEVETSLARKDWNAVFRISYGTLWGDSQTLWAAAAGLFEAGRERESAALAFRAVRISEELPDSAVVPEGAGTWLAMASTRSPQLRDLLRAKAGPFSEGDNAAPPLGLKWRVEREQRAAPWFDDGSVAGVQWVVTGSGKVYHLETGKLKAVLDGIGKSVHCAGFSGGRLVVWVQDQLVGYDPVTLARAWSVSIGSAPEIAPAAVISTPEQVMRQQMLHMQVGRRGMQGEIAADELVPSMLSTCNDLLVLVTETKLCIVDCAWGERIWEAEVSNPRAVWTSPQGRIVVTGPETCQVRDASTGRKLGDLDLGEVAEGQYMFGGTGETFVILRQLSAQSSGVATRLEVKTITLDRSGKPTQDWELPVEGAHNPRLAVRISDDLLIGAGAQILRIELATGKRKELIDLAQAFNKKGFTVLRLEATGDGIYALCGAGAQLPAGGWWGGSQPAEMARVRSGRGMVGTLFMLHFPHGNSKNRWATQEFEATGCYDFAVSRSHAFFCGLVGGIGSAPAPQLLAIELKSGKVADKQVLPPGSTFDISRRASGVLVQTLSQAGEVTLSQFQQSSR